MSDVLQVQCNSLCSLSAGAVAVLWLAALLQLLPGEFHQAHHLGSNFVALQLILAPGGLTVVFVSWGPTQGQQTEFCSCFRQGC